MTFKLLGQLRTCTSASAVLVEILRTIAARDPQRIPTLAEAVRGRTRSHIARTVAEIYPDRPDLARAAEFAPGWLIGLNLSNRGKLGIIRAACDIYGLSMPGDLDLELPNT